MEHLLRNAKYTQFRDTPNKKVKLYQNSHNTVYRAPCLVFRLNSLHFVPQTSDTPNSLGNIQIKIIIIVKRE